MFIFRDLCFPAKFKSWLFLLGYAFTCREYKLICQLVVMFLWVDVSEKSCFSFQLFSSLFKIYIVQEISHDWRTYIFISFFSSQNKRLNYYLKTFNKSNENSSSVHMTEASHKKCSLRLTAHLTISTVFVSFSMSLRLFIMLVFLSCNILL